MYQVKKAKRVNMTESFFVFNHLNPSSLKYMNLDLFYVNKELVENEKNEKKNF